MVDDVRTDDGRTDGRTPDHGHPISSPCEPDGSGELIKRTTTHCYIQNMKALGHVVSEKKIFLCFAPSRPRGGACMDPRGTVGRIYKEDHYTLLHTKYERSGTSGFGEEIFLCFSHCKSMGAICCHGNQSSNPTCPKTLHSLSPSSMML